MCNHRSANDGPRPPPPKRPRSPDSRGPKRGFADTDPIVTITPASPSTLTGDNCRGFRTPISGDDFSARVDDNHGWTEDDAPRPLMGVTHPPRLVGIQAT